MSHERWMSSWLRLLAHSHSHSCVWTLMWRQVRVKFFLHSHSCVLSHKKNVFPFFWVTQKMWLVFLRDVTHFLWVTKKMWLIFFAFSFMCLISLTHALWREGRSWARDEEKDFSSRSHSLSHSHPCVWSLSHWSQETPPPGGVLCWLVPWSRAVCKRFHDEMRRSHLVVKSLTHGSWSGNQSTLEPPRRGGVPAINMLSEEKEESRACEEKKDFSSYSHSHSHSHSCVWSLSHVFSEK